MAELGLQKLGMSDLQLAVLRYISKNDLIRVVSSLMRGNSQKKLRCAVEIPIHINVANVFECEGILAEAIIRSPSVVEEIFQNVINAMTQVIRFNINKITQSDSKSVGNYSMKPGSETATTPTLTLDIRRSDPVDFEILPHAEFDVNGNVANGLTLPKVHMRLEVDGLPYVHPWKVGSVKEFPLDLEEPRLAVVSGMVMAVSSAVSYTKWLQYRCGSDKCKKPEVITVTKAGYIKDPINESRVCSSEDNFTNPLIILSSSCFSALEEDPSTREIGEKVKVILVPDGQLKIGESGHKQCMTLTLRGSNDPTHCCEPGQKLEASVFINPCSKGYPSIEVSKIYPELPVRPPAHLPDIIRKLKDDRKDSPWSFVLTLAYIFGSTVSPPGTFHRLKMALLLSLASCSGSECGLAVLAVGKNDSMHSQLFQYASRCAPRAIWHSSINTLGASVSRDNDGIAWIEAGSLLRARGGVCVVTDLSYTKKDVKNNVFDVLESRSIRVNTSNRLRDPTRTVSYALRAAVWSSYNPCHSRRQGKLSEDEDLFLHVPVGELTKSITDVFGMVIYTDSPSNNCEDTETKMCLQVLLDSMQQHQQPEPLLPPKDLLQFLELIRGTQVTFSAEAENLLRGYYVVNRLLRGDCVQGSAMPVTAINTLTEVAKCHTRLSLRTKVEIWDAAAAVLLCEEALTSRFGLSPLDVKPCPHLTSNTDLHHLLGRKNDERMFTFIKKLENLISEHNY